MNDHAQNFKLETRKNTFDCVKRNERVGNETWEVEMTKHGGAVTGRLVLSKNWSRTMVFQYLNSLEQGDL